MRVSLSILPGTREDRPWQVLLCLLPFVHLAAVLLPPPLGLGLQHANDFQACRIWWKTMGTVCLQDGFFPLWNHLQDYGSVYPGYTGYGILYPFTAWLHPFLATEIPAVQSAAEYLSIGLHAAWGANGAYLWLRRSAGGSPSAAALGAALLLLNQRFNDFIRYPGALEVQAWFPWILLLLSHLLDPSSATDPRRRWRHTLALAFCVSMAWLAGYGQLTYIFFLLAGTLFLAHLDRPRLWIWPAAGLVAGTLASVGTLYPTALHALTSPERGGGSLEFAASHPLLHGYLRMFTHPFQVDVLASSLFPVAFLPLIALGLAVAARARDRRWTLSLAGAALLIADLSLGEQGLLFRFFHAHVPMYSSFRVQGRNNFITLLPLAWFAAVGWDAARATSARRRWVAATMVLLALAVGLAARAEAPIPVSSAMEIFGMTAGQALRSQLLWLAGSTACLAAYLLAGNDRLRRIALPACVWCFVVFFCRWTTDYRPWPTTRVIPHYEAGLLTPHRIGIGTVQSPLLEELYHPVQQELDRLGRGQVFPSSRFLFSPEQPGGTPPRLTLRSLGPNHLIADVQSPSAGRLLLIQSWHAGWKSSLPLRRAPGVLAPLSVLDLPAGEHRLDLRFRPTGILLAVGLSLLVPAFLAAAALLLAGRRRLAGLTAGAGVLALALFLAGVYTTHSWPEAFLGGTRGQSFDPEGRVPAVEHGLWR